MTLLLKLATASYDLVRFPNLLLGVTFILDEMALTQSTVELFVTLRRHTTDFGFGFHVGFKIQQIYQLFRITASFVLYNQEMFNTGQ